jgi:hypothetical protein
MALEETLDDIARLREMLAEIDRILTVGFGRDIRPYASLAPDWGKALASYPLSTMSIGSAGMSAAPATSLA